MDLGSWNEVVELETPAGRALQTLVDILPEASAYKITLFGSAPIQLTIDRTLLNGVIDVFSDHDDLSEIVAKAGLGEGTSDFHIQVGSELNFRTSPRWRSRSQSLQIRNCTIEIPHPMDILIAKLNRLEEKDIEAFRVVRRKTGHPTEEELIHELQLAVDLFRPNFDEEQAHDLADNCRALWPIIFGREIDPRREIIVPALKQRKDGYGEPDRDYKQELREAVESYKTEQ
jgi:hypothetical protein